MIPNEEHFLHILPSAAQCRHGGTETDRSEYCSRSNTALKATMIKLKSIKSSFAQNPSLVRPVLRRPVFNKDQTFPRQVIVAGG